MRLNANFVVNACVQKSLENPIKDCLKRARNLSFYLHKLFIWASFMALTKCVSNEQKRKYLFFAQKLEEQKGPDLIKFDLCVCVKES